MSKSHDTQRWVTLVSCLLASLCAGFGYTWSVLLKPIGQEFGWRASAVSLSFTVLIVFAASTSIFVGKALQYLQPRTCLLSGAVVFGDRHRLHRFRELPGDALRPLHGLGRRSRHHLSGRHDDQPDPLLPRQAGPGLRVAGRRLRHRAGRLGAGLGRADRRTSG